MPYDLNNPANWTAAQLRAELAQKGLNLTGSVPKTVLKQIYEQMINSDKTNSGHHAEPVGHSDQNEDVSSQNVQSSDNTETNSLPVTSDSATGQSNTLTDSVTTSSSTTGSAAPVSSNNDVTQLLVQNTLGMMTSMQSAISSLQSTVNTLITKQSVTGTETKNNLDKFYNAMPVTTEQQVQPVTGLTPIMSKTNSGVAADELPHIDVVTDSVKRNIITGKYVNLACLLIPDFEAPKASTDDMNGLEFLRRDRKDHRLDRALNITQFYKAFGIYKRIMCEAYPLRRNELDLYEADIGVIFEHYGNIFYQYHVQFSKQAAAYLEKGIKVDWSKCHKDLFQLLVGGVKTKSCDHCGQADHQSPFCPTQINQSFPSGIKNFSDGVKREPSQDRHGRLRVMHKGKEICNNFNSVKGCLSAACSFLHICKKCKKTGHGENSCETQSKQVPSEVTNSSEKPKTIN